MSQSLCSQDIAVLKKKSYILALRGNFGPIRKGPPYENKATEDKLCILFSFLLFEFFELLNR